CQHYNNLALTF
nr:immunoglobulin light chain junction region [Macaca mulatta]MOX48093.1 immunoglobulin light chain junction region [Macaca mulatta]MOX48257.1 immunoglobulin light chain junction region [Macaca mulatta]MOX48471.1 immunoglobulin light chain junction region [Macaca mulatta]MOX48569.1 immunoglobulin light chain junction region [Macaca mulatta]